MGATSNPDIPLSQGRPLLGDYRLERQIGQGGMGTVFLATQLRLDRHVALKVLPPQLAHDDELTGRFRTEASTLAKLQHPAIVQVIDQFEAEGLFCIAMEYLAGGSLGAMLKQQGRLPEEVAAAIVSDAAEGLWAAARAGIVHRDVKPDNILFTMEGRTKVVDFGLARAHEQTRVTQSGMVMGTPTYMAPEQWQDSRAADHRSDLYSLGGTLFHLITGEPPFPGPSVFNYLKQHTSDPPPHPGRLGSGVTPELAEICHRLLQKDPADRFASGSELARALKPFLPSQPETLSGFVRGVLLRREDDGDEVETEAETVQTPLRSHQEVTLATAHPEQLSAMLERPDPSEPIAVTPTPAENRAASEEADRPLSKLLLAVGPLLLVALLTWVFWPNPPAEPGPKILPGPMATDSSFGWREEALPAGLHRGEEEGAYRFEGPDGLELSMVRVPAGPFTMGVNQGEADEGPRHTHHTGEFWIGRYEVTWADYLRFCRATERKQPQPPQFGVRDEHPVVNVTFEDAEAFCDWAGLRLPTEAQWEKAALGVDGQVNPWGDGSWAPDRANLCDASCPESFPKATEEDGFPYTAPVGSFPQDQSPFGAFDMGGNVMEWCRDWYHEKSYEQYARGDYIAPRQGTERVVRGGNWRAAPRFAHGTQRIASPPTAASPVIGFRVVLEGSEAPNSPPGAERIQRKQPIEKKRSKVDEEQQQQQQLVPRKEDY